MIAAGAVALLAGDAGGGKGACHALEPVLLDAAVLLGGLPPRGVAGPAVVGLGADGFVSVVSAPLLVGQVVPSGCIRIGDVRG